MLTCVRVRAALLAACMASGCLFQPMSAYALQRVEITGQREGEEWTGLDYGPGGVGGAGSSGEAPIGEESTEVAAVNPVKDVRCYSGPGSDTVSTADPTAKWGIATRMQNAARAAGSGGRAGSLFTVTWADGGSSTYLVTGAIGDAALNMTAVKETVGDGVPKDGAACGAT
jgi:hypothetical protein